MDDPEDTIQKLNAYGPVMFLVAANLIPVIGVLLWGWDLSVLLFLYWLESFIIGAVNFAYISVSNGPRRERVRTGLFFVVHYGGFWLGHGLFLFVLLMPEIDKYANSESAGIIASPQTVRYALWGFIISHVLGFVINTLSRQKSERLPPVAQMFTPYGRVFVMHLVILGGAYLAARFANVITVLLLFVGLKILFELGTMVVGKNWRNTIEQKGSLE